MKMKKFLVLVTTLVLIAGLSTGLADGRTAPEDLSVYTTTDIVDKETSYKRYDMTFYDAESTQPGTVVKVPYTTDVYGDTLDTWANVYLPYGYDENGTEQYNIIYFLHGSNETQDSFIGDPRAKNAVDNMIEAGITEPFIMVFPTYYNDYETRAIDMTNFPLEVRNDLIPTVEGMYRTYAPSVDEAGFIASRDHRAFAGYSRGSYATWHMFFNLLDYSKWYMPFSGAISGAAEMSMEATPDEQIAALQQAIDANSDYKDDFFIYAACGGGRDMMYGVMNAQIKAMVADTEYFSYGMNPQENNLFYCLSKEVHQTLMSRYYLYNAFDVVFK